MTALLQNTEIRAPILNGLGDVADRYNSFVLDIFGVIHNGVKLYPETVKCLTELKTMGKATCLVSNTPRRFAGIEEDLESIGLPRDLYDHIVTAGDSAYEALKDYEGQTCWFAGTERYSALLEGLDIKTTDTPEGANFILNAISGEYPLDADKIYAELEKCLEADLPMICANPDLIVNIGDETYICAGMYADWYLEQGGSVSYHGKPHAPVYDRAFELMGETDKSKALAIGDALKTDIQGANRYGFDSIMNLVGIHWEELAIEHRADGNYTDEDLHKIQTMIEAQDYRPNFILYGFTW